MSIYERFDRGMVGSDILSGYTVNHYCLRLDRGVVCIVVGAYIVDYYCLWFGREVFHSVVVEYIVYHYCLRFDRGVACVVVGHIVYQYCLTFHCESRQDKMNKCRGYLWYLVRANLSCCVHCVQNISMYRYDIPWDNSADRHHQRSLKITKGTPEAAHRRRADNTMTKRKRTKGQRTIYKTRHRKLKIKQHETH